MENTQQAANEFFDSNYFDTESIEDIMRKHIRRNWTFEVDEIYDADKMIIYLAEHTQPEGETPSLFNRNFSVDEIARLMVIQISLPDTFTENNVFNREKFDNFLISNNYGKSE